MQVEVREPDGPIIDAVALVRDEPGLKVLVASLNKTVTQVRVDGEIVKIDAVDIPSGRFTVAEVTLRLIRPSGWPYVWIVSASKFESCLVAITCVDTAEVIESPKIHKMAK